MKKPAVKICCISSKQEAQLAIELGASAIGLVSHMPSGPGVISEKLITEIAASVPENIDTFKLTSLQNAEEIIAQHRRCTTTAIQLVDEVTSDVIKQINRTLPNVDLVQVIHVTGKAAVQKATEVAPYVDALLLDSGDPTLKVKELGGTGRTHNWEISRNIVQTIAKPVYLAGGLNPQNITEAIRRVNPYGVDVCNGLRTNGGLNREKTTRFFKQIHAYNFNK